MKEIQEKPTLTMQVSKEMHWVIGVGLDDSEVVLIYDPWTNDIVRFRDRYKQGPARFGSYKGINMIL
ncbi:MAG: hypothetical protein ABFC84_09760 [Veillonellales bacterium]